MQHKNIHLARALRANQTKAELKMWQALRGGSLMHYKFRRQVPLNDYILDFVCFEQKVIVEIDGSQHLQSTADNVRDANLQALGFKVLRFWNNQVFENLEGVLTMILQNLQNETPHPSPLPQGERELRNLFYDNSCSNRGF